MSRRVQAALRAGALRAGALRAIALRAGAIALLACVLAVAVPAARFVGPAHAQDAPPPDAIAPDAVVMPMDAVLRLRAAPATESAILDLLMPGTALDVLARTEDSRWLAVRTDRGRIGWVWSVYLIVNADLAGVCVVGDETALAVCAGFDAAVALRAAEIHAVGAARGQDDRVFAKVGDSITVNQSFLRPVGLGQASLGVYGALGPVIEHYRAGRIGTDNPFTRDSAASGVGWTAATVFNPEAARSECAPGETPLDCEYRIARPSVALIMFGTNDVGYVPPDTYRANLDRIVRTSAERGIIPIVSTLPTREGYEGAVVAFNGIIREVAAEHRVPLWDYHAALATLPESGLSWDGVHPSEGPLGPEGAAVFTPSQLQYGYVVRNLTALQMLDAVWAATR
jgi:hypothetical protein